MMSQWFYNQGGVQMGPVPAATLRDLVLARQLAADDLVWAEGMVSWLPMNQVPSLQSMLASMPPAPSYPQPPAYAPPTPGPVVGPQYGMPNYGYPGQMGPSSNGVAIAGFVLSLFPFLSLLGLIFSIIALNGMKKTGNPEGKGLAIAGLVISIVFLSISCFWFSLAAAFMKASGH
jgi:hypothetical protein